MTICNCPNGLVTFAVAGTRHVNGVTMYQGFKNKKLSNIICWPAQDYIAKDLLLPRRQVIWLWQWAANYL